MSWKRRAEPLVRPLMQFWWRRTRGMTLGVRGIAVREDGCVALVRHTYVPGWHLPGGGVEAGESAQLSITRELAEEAGIALQSPARLFGVYANHARFRGDHVLVYVTEDWRACESDSDGEIEAVCWVKPDAPPEGTTAATRRRLAEFLGTDPVRETW
jgi:8-oxo-dGTP pyrophosphatase MutT (NUDIX family)